jgi:farnesyl-diphosphate farnesyltransferase
MPMRVLLKQVSRSFYLTLMAVPRSVRDQIGLAYLFARAADTIADTDLIERRERLHFLHEFRAQFAGADGVDRDAVRSIQAALVPHQRDSGERRLLERLGDCFRLHDDLDHADRRRICALMTTLTKGMEMDLTEFPGDSAEALRALRTMDDLDLYTYYVAGCVGEFWTGMMCAHVPSLSQWNEDDMAKIGVRFGKGLQMTNILKDLARDLNRGRCYLPESLLREAGLAARDLLKPEALPAFRPVLRRLLVLAMEHLDQGWCYTMAIPRREVRLRLACMWPLLFAAGTLARVATSGELLNPVVVPKISKGEVYRVMAATTLTAGCGYVGTAYWGMLRKRVL